MTAARYQQASPVAAYSSDTASADNADAVITYPAVDAHTAHVLSGVAGGYSGGAGRLTVKDGTNVIFDHWVGSDFIPFNPPKIGTPGNSMTITLAGGGFDVVGKVNAVSHWTQYSAGAGQGGLLGGFLGLDFSDKNNSQYL